MNLQAWPFLVTRNNTHEYMTVVSPKFLYDAQTSGFLSTAVSGDATEPGWVICREIQGLSSGVITIIFRIVLAREKDLGLETDELLYDQYHRPINLITGLVLEGSKQDINITAQVFNTVYSLVQERFRSFWQDTSNTPRGYPSQRITLSIASDEKKYLRVRTLPTFQALVTIPARQAKEVSESSSSSPDDFTGLNQKLVLLAGGLVAAGGLLIGYLLSRGK